MRYFVQFERNKTIYCYFEIFTHKDQEKTNDKTQSNKKKILILLVLLKLIEKKIYFE
jgi:hypothetical protein